MTPILLVASTAALFLAERLPRKGPVRGRLYPLTVGGLSVVCIGLTVPVAVHFDSRTAVPLTCSAVSLAVAGRRRSALLIAERDRLLRRPLAGRAGRGRGL